ncbi:MAG TPA: cobalt-precorrin-6A reductase [Mycobacteriales bacterium]|nr:cobalt-precorrin-6A reductase [Mycobacteriales bacterium]
MSDTPVVLLLGGTTEARALAERLAASNLRVISSLAGRVSRPAMPVGEVRIGGFGGADGLAAWLRDHAAIGVVDATHPFAATISRNAAEACHATNTPLLRLERPGWDAEPGDSWHEVDSLDAAAAILPRLGRRVFLTTGRQELAPFASLADLWFLVRCVDPPTEALPPQAEVLLARGPYDAAAERALMQQHRIDVLVTKNSGGEMTRGKLTAARELGVPVVMVSRPELPQVPGCESPDDAATWVSALRTSGG